MKKFILTVAAFVLYCSNVFSQSCPGCAINQAAFPPNPGPLDLGISPDTLYVVQGQATSQDITYLMPTQAVSGGITATVTEVKIIGVSGFPIGLQWTCDNFNNGCKYDPRVNRWGCVRVCGTTFDAPGVYSVIVNVVGTGCASGICQSQTNPIPFIVIVERDPSAGCSSYFSFTPSGVCDSSSVLFKGVRVSPDPAVYPLEFIWDYDNGNTGTGKNPPSEFFGAPGEYYPTVTINNLEFIVTDVTATSNGSWWCGDIEEPNVITCQGSPDMFFKLTTGGNTTTSTTVNNNLTASWSGLTVPIESPAFSLAFWDEDGRCAVFCSADDDGGTTIITINQNNGNNGAGTYSFTTTAPSGGGVSGSLTLALRVKSSDSCTDTFTIFQSPAKPTITNLGLDTVCAGDTVTLVASAADSYKWFRDTTLLSNVDSFLLTNTAGKYVVQVKEAGNTCTTNSDSIAIGFQQYPVPPIIQNNGGTLTINNPGNYTVNWYDNGNIIAGENGNTLSNLSGTGPYTAEFVTTAGCASQSQPFVLCVTGSVVPLSVDTLRCCDSIPNSLTATATGFSFGSTSVIAWGITAAAQGPIDSDAYAQAAQAQGNVFVDDNGFDLSTCTSALTEGMYYLTPFVIDNPSVDPLLYDTLNGCRPDAQLCPVISGTGWVINPLVFGFPDGSSVNINQQFIFGADIDENLWATLTASGPFCLALSTLFAGDPNGTWTISVTNIGTGSLDISVPAFEVRVSADSCAALNGTDQVVTINPVTANASPGQTKTVILEIPPLPSNFPSVNPACNAFGTPAQFYYKACTNSVEDISIPVTSFNVYPNPNNGLFNIEFKSLKNQDVEIVLFNNLGQAIASKNVLEINGNYKTHMNLADVASGVYHIILKTKDGVLNKRLLIE
jgi:hypothetical protein